MVKKKSKRMVSHGNIPCVNNDQPKAQIHEKLRKLSIKDIDFGYKTTDETHKFCQRITRDLKHTKNLLRILAELLHDGNSTYFTKVDTNGIRHRCSYLDANFDNGSASQFIFILNDGTGYYIEVCFPFLQHWFFILKNEEKIEIIKNLESFNKYKFDMTSSIENQYKGCLRHSEDLAFESKKQLINATKNPENSEAINLMWNTIDKMQAEDSNFSKRKMINLLRQEIDGICGAILIFWFEVDGFNSINYRPSDGFYVILEEKETGDTIDIGANKFIQLCHAELNNLKKSVKTKIVSRKNKCDFSTILDKFTYNDEIDEIVEWTKTNLLKFSKTFQDIDNINLYEKKRFLQTRNAVESFKLNEQNLCEVIQACESCANVEHLTAVEFASLIDLGLIIWHDYDKENKKQLRMNIPSNNNTIEDASRFKNAIRQLFLKVEQLGPRLHEYIGLQVIEPFLSHQQTIESIKNLQLRVRFASKYTLMYHYISHHVLGTRNVASVQEAIERFQFRFFDYYNHAMEIIRKSKSITSTWGQIGCGRSFDFYWQANEKLEHCVAVEVSECGEVFLKTYHKKDIKQVPKRHKEHKFIKLSTIPDLSMYDPFVCYWDNTIETIQGNNKFRDELQKLPYINKINLNDHFVERDEDFLNFRMKDFEEKEIICSSSRAVFKLYSYKPKKQDVVLKFISLPRFREPNFEQTISSIKHEVNTYFKCRNSIHIVQFYGYSLYEHQIIHCIELMHSSLNDFYRGSHRMLGYFSEELLGCISVSVCDALKWLKDHNLKHQGLTPNKILFKQNGLIKLLLKGWSEMLDSSGSSTLMTNMLYIDIEYCLQDSDLKEGLLDIWALGMIMLEAMIGEHPIYVNVNRSHFAIEVLPLLHRFKDVDKEKFINEHFSHKINNTLKEFICLCLEKPVRRPNVENLMESSLYQNYSIISMTEIIKNWLKEIEIFDRVLYKETSILLDNKFFLSYLSEAQLKFMGKLHFPDDLELYEFSFKDLKELSIIDQTRHILKEYVHLKTNRKIIIKFLQMKNFRFQDEQEEEQIKKFIQELTVQRVLRHSKNIVQFYGWCLHENRVLLGMEKMDMDLKTFYLGVHQIHNKFNEDLLACVATSIIDALTYCSVFKIIHRDIKPSNILLNKSGEIKLCDFGEAKILNDNSLAITSVGTPYYWPIDRFDVAEYDASTDIWSLGITLAEVANGRIPIQDKNGRLPRDIVTLRLTLRDTHAKEIINRCFNILTYSERCRNFVELCLADIESRPKKYDALRKTDFYEYYEKQVNDDIVKQAISAITKNKIQ